MAAVYCNPMNGRRERVGNPFWGVLFGGSFYFAIKGVWTHAVVSFILAVITFGFSWLVYPFFARSIMETHYERSGWRRVGWGHPAATGHRGAAVGPLVSIDYGNPWAGIE